MIITFWKGVFVADSLDERGALKRAGFELHEPTVCHLKGEQCKACRAKIGRRWWSARVEDATRLEPYCNEKAISVMRHHLELLRKSRATTANLNIPCPPGLSYLPYQKAGIAYAIGRKDTMIGDDMGLGKQQPVDTKVATPNGWRRIGDLKPGDFVLSVDGGPTRVLKVFPQGKKPSYRITFSDHSSVEAGPEHLWTILYRRGGRVWDTLTLTTEELRKRPKKGRMHLSKTKLYLPMLEGPALFKHQIKLRIDPYIVGALIANGGLLGSSATLSFNTLDKEHILKKIVDIRKTNTYGGSSRGVVLGVIDDVRRLGMNVHSPKKSIPEPYMRASPEDRVSLLQGLMDCDGSISKTGNRLTYHTTSKRLAEDVRELVESLGGISSIRPYDRSHENKPLEYQVRLRLPTWVQPFTSPRKLSRYNPGRLARPVRTVKSVRYVRDVESVCIAVEHPSRLYATEHYILTHNTVQALGFINYIKPKNAIIVCPATLVFNWRNEAEKWLVGDWDIVEIESKNDRLPERDGLFVIVNYEKLPGDSPFSASIASRTWDVMVADEAHYLKNPESKRSQAVIGAEGLMAKSHRCLFLTGTPIENYPKEIWPIASAISPAKFSDWWAFAKRYCGAHKEERNGRQVWVTEGATHLAELQQRLRASFLVRRLKRDVLPELPPKRRQLIVLRDDKHPWTNDPRFRRWQQAFDAEYDAKVAAVEAARTEAEFIEAVAALEKISGIPFEEISELRHQMGLAKLPACKKFLDEMRASTPEPLVIFAHHRDVIEDLTNHFGPDCLVVHGQTPHKGPRSREEAVRAFQNGEKQIFIGQMKAAGVGLTLTRASTVVFVEEDWVPGTITQCEDRLCRIGQKKMVHVIHLVLRDTIEVNMVQKVLAKQKVIDAALDRFPALKLKAS